MTKTMVVHVRLPADLHAWILGQAEEKKMSIADVVRYLLVVSREGDRHAQASLAKVRG